MLFRYPSGASRHTSGGESSRIGFPRSSRSGGYTLLELLHKDVDVSETYETLDREFDAVVVNKTLPRKTEAALSSSGESAQQFVNRDEHPVVQLREAQSTRSAKTSKESKVSAEHQGESADLGRGGDCKAYASGELKGIDRKEEEESGNVDVESTHETVSTSEFVAPGCTSGAVNWEEGSGHGDKQFVETVPNNSGASKLEEAEVDAQTMVYNVDNHDITGAEGDITHSFLVAAPPDDTYLKTMGETEKVSEGNRVQNLEGKEENLREKKRGDVCEEQPAAVSECRVYDTDKSVQLTPTGGTCVKMVKDPKNLSVHMDRDVQGEESTRVTQLSIGNITSQKSSAIHGERKRELTVVERGVPCLESSSQASRPESIPTAYGSSEVRPDEITSDYESFESTSDASLEAPNSEGGSDEEDNQTLRSDSLREVEGFYGDDLDDSSMHDEDNYHYAVQSVSPGGTGIGETSDTGPQRDASSCAYSGSEEGTFGPPSTTSQESDASEETMKAINGSRSALVHPEDNMYDSEEQLQQFAQLLQFWRAKESQASSPIGQARAQSQHRKSWFRRPQMHDAVESQLREDLKAIRTVVGDRQAARGPLARDIAELSEVLGIDLPLMSDEKMELEWAQAAIGVMKFVVGFE